MGCKLSVAQKVGSLGFNTLFGALVLPPSLMKLLSDFEVFQRRREFVVLHLRAERVQLEVDDVLLACNAAALVLGAVFSPRVFSSAFLLGSLSGLAGVLHAASFLSTPALARDLLAFLEHRAALTCAVVPLPAHHH